MMEIDKQTIEYYQRVDAGDVPGLLALFTEDAVYRRPGYPPLIGRDALERFYREQRIIRAGCHSLAATVAQGDSVAVHGVFEGALRDGRQVTLRFADFFEFTGAGVIRARDTFFFAPLV
jgi:ketosteroid isomerase-like protein